MNEDRKRRKAVPNRTVSEVADDAVKYSELINLLPSNNDLTLVVLKGHLIAEQLLEMILVRLLHVSELPKKGRLQFLQKLKLVEKVVCESEPGPNADLLCVIENLNEIRNNLAHKLNTPEEIKASVGNLIKSYYARKGQKVPKGWENDLHGHLTICLLALCQFLLKIRLHFELEKG